MVVDPLKTTRDGKKAEDIEASVEETSLQPEDSNAPQAVSLSADLTQPSASRTIKVGS